VDAGTLTDEQALVYKVYATFSDSRLPAEHMGEPVEELESNIMIEAAARRSTLSSETLALLAPFFQPPAFEGTWAADRLVHSSPQARGHGHRALGRHALHHALSGPHHQGSRQDPLRGNAALRKSVREEHGRDHRGPHQTVDCRDTPARGSFVRRLNR
jgi:hypothetical protein